MIPHMNYLGKNSEISVFKLSKVDNMIQNNISDNCSIVFAAKSAAECSVFQQKHCSKFKEGSTHHGESVTCVLAA